MFGFRNQSRRKRQEGGVGLMTALKGRSRAIVSRGQSKAVPHGGTVGMTGGAIGSASARRERRYGSDPQAARDRESWSFLAALGRGVPNTLVSVSPWLRRDGPSHFERPFTRRLTLLPGMEASCGLRFDTRNGLSAAGFASLPACWCQGQSTSRHAGLAPIVQGWK